MGDTIHTTDKVKFINATDYKFTDITGEVYREYTYISESGTKTILRFERPALLHVSESGGHRLFTSDGKSHYIKNGWVSVSWETFEGLPNFVC